MSGGVSCDRCGIARPRDLVLVGIAFARRVSVERELCPTCAERVLAGMGDALGEKTSRGMDPTADPPRLRP